MNPTIVPEVFGATFIKRLEVLPANNEAKGNTWTTEETHYDHDDD